MAPPNFDCLDEVLIQYANECSARDSPWESRAWMLTASKLFPESFEIIMERYSLAKLNSGKKTFIV